MLKLGNYLLCGWLLAAWCGSAAAGVQAVPDRDSSVYAPGEAVRFSFRPDGAERIVCRVLDFDRKTVREAALKAGEELRLDTLENGYYDLEFEAFDAAGKRTGRGSWPFAVIPEVDRSKLDWTRNQFGAMVMPHTAYPLADRKRDAEMMSRIGIRFVRTQRLSWIQIQPDENRPPDWTMSDRETEIYLDNHLAIVANTGWPLQLWASSGHGSGMRNPDKMFPAGDRMEQLKSFYTELAKRYRGRIAYWEVGNEVDAALFWLGRPENAAAGNKDAILKDFCDYYTVVARAIRAGDPEAKIGPNTTGAAPDGHTYRDWLRKFLSDPEANREMDFFFESLPLRHSGDPQCFRREGKGAGDRRHRHRDRRHGARGRPHDSDLAGEEEQYPRDLHPVRRGMDRGRQGALQVPAARHPEYSAAGVDCRDA